jgi:hypothetical protein
MPIPYARPQDRRSGPTPRRSVPHRLVDAERPGDRRGQIEDPHTRQGMSRRARPATARPATDAAAGVVTS